MKKFLLVYASYSDVDHELFVDCLGIYDTLEQAKQAEVQSREEDDDDMERVYSIKEITIKQNKRQAKVLEEGRVC